MRLLVSIVVVVLLTAAPAFADVTVDKRMVAAGSEQELVFSVPDEYDGPGAFVTYVEIDFPEGFTLVECIPLEGWGCSADHTGRRATFQRTPPSVGNDGDDNQLGVRVRSAPTAGRYAIEVKQWYKSGQVVSWNGPAGSDRPAPVVEVTGSAPAVTGPVEVPSDTTPDVRTLVSPELRTRSADRPVGVILAAAAAMGALACALWWRRRSVSLGRV